MCRLAAIVVGKKCLVPEGGIAEFSITADRCPQLLCRLLGLIAQQDRPVHSLTVTSSLYRHRLALAVLDLDRHRAAIIAEKMRGLVQVRTVQLQFR